jgi:hypothetical protein
VISRQHPQTAGIDEQRLMQAKFHRKIGYKPVAQVGIGARKPGLFGLHILVKRTHHAVVKIDIIAIIHHCV